MKLRIKGDSLRLRITPREVSRLLETGRIEETIHFGPETDARLSYALMTQSARENVMVRYLPGEITVLISTEQARIWAESDHVGIYGAVEISCGQLQLAIEKDFACLDKDDTENQDRYPNPNQGAVC